MRFEAARPAAEAAPIDDAARQRHALHLSTDSATTGGRHIGETDQFQHLRDLAVGFAARDFPCLSG